MGNFVRCFWHDKLPVNFKTTGLQLQAWLVWCWFRKYLNVNPQCQQTSIMGTFLMVCHYMSVKRKPWEHHCRPSSGQQSVFFTSAYLFMPEGHSLLSKTVLNRASWILDGHLGNFHLLLHYSVLKFLNCICEVQRNRSSESRIHFHERSKLRQASVTSLTLLFVKVDPGRFLHC